VINVARYAPSNGSTCYFYGSWTKNVSRNRAISLIKYFTLDGVRLSSNVIKINHDFFDKCKSSSIVIYFIIFLINAKAAALLLR
jgi:hypothetical protein